MSLLVLVTSAALFQRYHILKSLFLLAAGSSLPILTTSGVSSEDANAIDGPYGYVTTSDKVLLRVSLV